MYKLSKRIYKKKMDKEQLQAKLINSDAMVCNLHLVTVYPISLLSKKS